jgi:hypothetical protein
LILLLSRADPQADLQASRMQDNRASMILTQGS